MVRTARILKDVALASDLPLDDGSGEGLLLVARETARIALATAISSREGSKKMLEPTDTTRRVIGGSGCEGAEESYRGTAASQSSLKSGSSSASETSAGRRVDRRARWVVRDRRGTGYESGGERSRIYMAHKN